MPRALPMLLGILTIPLVLPACVPLAQLIRGAWHEGVGPFLLTSLQWRLLGTSFLTAFTISMIACAIAAPLAWGSRRLPRGFTLLAAVPLLMPSYLAFAGWGQLIAPGTRVGDLLAAGPPTGPNWWPLAASRTLAVLGLGLWAWPLAFIPIAAGAHRLDGSMLEARRLDPGSRVRRAGFVIRVLAGPVALAWTLVALVMLGSAIPLHLAQAPTYSIALWTELSLTPDAQTWRIWAKAWPLIIPAFAGAVLVPAVLGRTRELHAHTTVRRARWPIALLLGIVAVSVIVPAILLGQPVRSLAAFGRFVRLNADAIAASGLVALGVGLFGALLAFCAWSTVAWARSRRSFSFVLGLLIGWALVPGVLTGHALAAAVIRLPSPISDSHWPVIMAHVGRFGFVALLLGWFFAHSEPSDLPSLRRLDGADSLCGLLLGDARNLTPGLVASALVLACLSLHEIESTIMVQPPGVDSLARRILELLHYQRMEDVGVAVLWTVFLAIAASAAIMVLFRNRANSPPRTSRIMLGE